MKNCRKNCRIKRVLFGDIWSNMIKIPFPEKRSCFSVSQSKYGVEASVGAWIRTSILRIRRPGLLASDRVNSRLSACQLKLPREVPYLVKNAVLTNLQLMSSRPIPPTPINSGASSRGVKAPHGMSCFGSSRIALWILNPTHPINLMCIKQRAAALKCSLSGLYAWSAVCAFVCSGVALGGGGLVGIDNGWHKSSHAGEPGERRGEPWILRVN